jgi:hypothetical protein
MVLGQVPRDTASRWGTQIWPLEVYLLPGMAKNQPQHISNTITYSRYLLQYKMHSSSNKIELVNHENHAHLQCCSPAHSPLELPALPSHPQPSKNLQMYHTFRKQFTILIVLGLQSVASRVDINVCPEQNVVTACLNIITAISSRVTISNMRRK